MNSRMDKYVLKSAVSKFKFTTIQLVALVTAAIIIPTGTYLGFKYIENQKNKVIEESTEGKIDVGQLQIQINAYPTFDSGTSQGSLLIANNIKNRYNMIVKIVMDDERVVYTSPKIEPGQKIDKDNLDVNLVKGEYKAIAYFSAYDRTNNSYVGQSAAQITLVIKK